MNLAILKQIGLLCLIICMGSADTRVSADDSSKSDTLIARQLLESWEVSTAAEQLTVKSVAEFESQNTLLVTMPFGVEIGANDDRVVIHNLNTIKKGESASYPLPRATRCYLVVVIKADSGTRSLWAKIPFVSLERKSSGLIGLGKTFEENNNNEKAHDYYAKALSLYPSTAASNELRSELERRDLLLKVNQLAGEVQADVKDYGVRAFPDAAKKLMAVIESREDEIRDKQAAEEARKAKLRDVESVVSSYVRHLKLFAEDDGDVAKLANAIDDAHDTHSLEAYYRAKRIASNIRARNSNNMEIEEFVAEALKLAKEEKNFDLTKRIAEELTSIANNKSSSDVMRALARDSLNGSTKTKDRMLIQLRKVLSHMPTEFKGQYACSACNGSGLLPHAEIERIKSIALAGGGNQRIDISCRGCNGKTFVTWPTVRWRDGSTTPIP